MARPRKDPGDQFSYGEKALAGQMSKSAFQHLTRLHPQLLPAHNIVERLGVIGGFIDGGVPLVLSAQIAQALAREFDDGEAPSGLKAVAEKEATAEELAALPADASDFHYHQLIVRAEERQMREAFASAKKVPLDDVPPFDYWESVERIRKEGRYYAGLVPAMDTDIRIEICDHRHVFMYPTSRLKSFWQDSAQERTSREKHPPHPSVPRTPGFVGWIEGWGRDSEMRFKHVAEVIEFEPADEPHRSRNERVKDQIVKAGREWADKHEAQKQDREKMWRAQAARLQVAAEQDVLPNAVGRLTVNVSLAIRRAFDRIAEHRAPRLRKHAESTSK